MLEIPEAYNMALQLRETIIGKTVTRVTAAHSSHKFAWFHGDPQAYESLLVGKRVDDANARGGMVEISIDDMRLLFGDGVNLRWHNKADVRPPKHQLLIEFAGDTALSAVVQMYGGLLCFKNGEIDNPYYTAACSKPSPLTDEFNMNYFEQLISGPEVQKLSAKAFLATEQRIPGLGNGVLQDILWQAGIHPKTKISLLNAEQRATIYQAVKNALVMMAENRGRDTEKDLYGNPGGYQTMMSKNQVGKPCIRCGESVKKETYLGGSIYYCGKCQPFCK